MVAILLFLAGRCSIAKKIDLKIADGGEPLCIVGNPWRNDRGEFDDITWTYITWTTYNLILDTLTNARAIIKP